MFSHEHPLQLNSLLVRYLLECESLLLLPVDAGAEAKSPPTNLVDKMMLETSLEAPSDPQSEQFVPIVTVLTTTLRLLMMPLR